MNYQVDDVITYNNSQYLVIDVILDSFNTYLFLINKDEYENDVSVVKVINNNGKIEYKNIENDNEFNYVINQIFLNSKDEIINLLEEK